MPPNMMQFKFKLKGKAPVGQSRRLLQSLGKLAQARSVAPTPKAEEASLSPKPVNPDLPPKRPSPGSMLGG